jgi:hypothetical protein
MLPLKQVDEKKTVAAHAIVGSFRVHRPLGMMTEPR